MKNILFTIALILTISSTGYSAAITDVKPEENAKENTEEQKIKELPTYDIGEFRVMHGISITPGISFNAASMTTEGTRQLRVSGGLAYRALMQFTYTSALLIEGGLNYYGIKEETDTFYRKYDLFYAFISASYALKFDKFLFYMGPYMEFIWLGMYEDSSTDYNDHDRFTFPVIGLTFGFGWFLTKGNGLKIYLGLNTKYQLLNFARTSSIGSRALGFYVDLTLYF